MRRHSGSVVIAAPLASTWDVCADLELLPEFISGLASCTSLGDERYRWRGRAFGIERSWVSEWVERRRPSFLAWRTDDPMVPDGRIVLEPLGRCRTRLSIELRYEPAGLIDRVLVNPVTTRLRLRWDLASFRRFVEARQTTSVRRAPESTPASAPSSALSARSSAGRTRGSS